MLFSKYKYPPPSSILDLNDKNLQAQYENIKLEAKRKSIILKWNLKETRTVFYLCPSCIGKITRGVLW